MRRTHVVVSWSFSLIKPGFSQLGDWQQSFRASAHVLPKRQPQEVTRKATAQNVNCTSNSIWKSQLQILIYGLFRRFFPRPPTWSLLSQKAILFLALMSLGSTHLIQRIEKTLNFLECGATNPRRRGTRSGGSLRTGSGKRCDARCAGRWMFVVMLLLFKGLQSHRFRNQMLWPDAMGLASNAG